MKPGIYTMPMRDYLADPAPEPSLSAGIAHTLLSRSPLHAWTGHPRLNPAYEEEEPTNEQDEGTALHALLLEQADIVEPIDAPDWRKKDAQAARAAAREAGQVPLLAHRLADIQDAAASIRSQLAGHADAAEALAHGKPEQVLLWQQDGIWCRARVDWLDDHPRGWLTDLKTVAGSAEPGAWGRNLASNGYALGAHHYLTGARALGREPAGYRWIVAERRPPFGVSVVTMAPTLADLARKQWEAAVKLWRECLRSGRWPAYPPHTSWIEAPPWAQMQWEEREMREEYAAQHRPAHVDPMQLREGLA